MPMDAMCMTMILLVETAELSYLAADHLINPFSAILCAIGMLRQLTQFDRLPTPALTHFPESVR